MPARFLARAAAFAVTLSLASNAAFAAAPQDRDAGIAIETLSTRANLVTGGDVLVRVSLPAGQTLGGTRVELNGSDITRVFRQEDGQSTLTGLVAGLRVGSNRISVSINGGQARTLEVTNHPITGPVFSGPHQQPFICKTATLTLPTGGTLGAPIDVDCSVATRVVYQYKSSAGGAFKPLPDQKNPPADVAKTTTLDGRSVNYIVRTETGTINRAIYQISVLHDPLLDTAITPWTRSQGWNGRLIYSFGGGCNAGYTQGGNTGGNGGDLFLSQGYAVASSSLNTFGNKCDDVISAETMMMVKEHFIEEFGVPRHTIGSGASGGSMQQHLIGNNYPGLLDAIQPQRSFPDTLTFTLPYMDCGLIDRAFKASSLNWTLEQKTAVSGHSTYAYCTTNIEGWAYRFVKPTGQCDTSIPPSQTYNKVTNPTGARCTYADDMVNVYGHDPKTGFARRPYDNVGVQYGLKAFNAGQISADQFLDLNAQVGGYDIDGNPVAARMVADPIALRIAYGTGRMNNAGMGLATIPIIDFRVYMDASGNVHDAVRSFVTRARLVKANGQANNQVILTSVGTASVSATQTADALRLTEQWLLNIEADQKPGSQAEKVGRNKPAELVDACYTDAGKVTDAARCQALFPISGNPRLAAGEPLTNDILKCELKPVRRADYAQALSDAQFARLKSIFASGVCDYGRPGVGQNERRNTWLGFSRPGASVPLGRD